MKQKKDGTKEMTVADRQKRWEDALREFNTSMKQVLRAVNYVTCAFSQLPSRSDIKPG